MTGDNSLKTIFYAPGANIAIAVAKLSAGAITGTTATLGESICIEADLDDQC